MTDRNYDDYILEKAEVCRKNDTISDDLFKQYHVNRGLRDVNGQGVLTGLTRISQINAFKMVDGVKTPCDGELWYRGHRIENLILGLKDGHPGFEKISYLLLFGELPTESELTEFTAQLAKYRHLPKNFTRDVVMKSPPADIMNSMTKSILTLATYDRQLTDNSLEHNIQQLLRLIAVFPMLACYAYHADNHYNHDGSMYIHRPKDTLSTSENFLRMLRPDSNYTPTEATALDACLILHMEHGGGNNSTFTTRVVTSSGSDAYSSIAAAMSSLKGPRHGGANLRVMGMIDNIKRNVHDVSDRAEMKDYLSKMLDGEVYDHAGLIYGMGHAVYSLSDPRERILKKFADALAQEKNMQQEMDLYRMIEELAPEIIAEKRHIYKGVSPNVDFYSGFTYEMMGIPRVLFTPLFAIARIVGWSAHRLEELVGNGKIIRPAYKSVMEKLDD